MRIVAGTFRGRALVAPKGQSTRPTADRVRQAMFDVLEHAPWSRPLRGARVVDLFAGSGALGFEALSRGAALCLFVERDPAAQAAIGANAARLGASERVRIDRRDAAALPRRAASDGAPFDLAFLDPPYGRRLVEAALARLADSGWLAPCAIVAAERGGADPAPTPAGYELLDERTWGAAKVSFYRRRPPTP
jgi:16S rRNA (guanine966-N2)-methyltransferase